MTLGFVSQVMQGTMYLESELRMGYGKRLGLLSALLRVANVDLMRVTTLTLYFFCEG